MRRAEPMDRGWMLHIEQPDAAKLILQTALEQTDVEHFEIKEPTLNEIFIREVGDSHE